MEGGLDLPPSEKAPKRLSTKLIALFIVIILVVAAVAVVLYLPGEAEAATVGVTSDKSSAIVEETVTLNASMTGGGTVTNYVWNFGDGETVDSGTVAQVKHSYSYPGSYLVITSAKDDKGKTSTNWVKPVSISVQAAGQVDPTNDSAPLAIAGVSADLVENGTAVIFDARASAAWSYETTPDGNADNYSLSLDMGYVKDFTWDFGDGSPEVTGDSSTCGNTTHTYEGDGAVYPAYVKVTSIHDTWQRFFVTVIVLPANVQQSSGYVKNPDTFVLDQSGQPMMLDPAVDYEILGGEVIQNVYETLIFYDGPSAVTLKPILATEVPTIANGGISPDGLNYTFHIRTNVKFHSGNILTPEDVRYSFERVLRINDPSGPSWMIGQVLVPSYGWDWRPQDNLAVIQNAVTVNDDDNSVTFHLQYPYPAFIYILAFSVCSVVDKDMVEAHGGIVDEQQNTWMNRNDAGSGPYEVIAWVEHQYIRMDAFDQYWQGAARIKHVYINQVDDAGTREMHLLSGDADCVIIDSNQRNDVKNRDELRVEQGAATFGVDSIGLNQNIQPSTLDIGDIPLDFFSDIHVRKAFAAAFDYDAYILNTFWESAIQPNGPIPKGMVLFNSSVPKYQYNVQTVIDEMKLALDTRTADPTDTYFDNGFRLTMFHLGDRYTQGAVERLAAGLTAALGSKVQISNQALDWGTAFLPALFSGQLTCFWVGWAPDYADPDDYITPFLLGGTTFAPCIGLDNASLNEKIIKAARELNETLRGQMYYDISMSCYENVYYIWTDQPTQFHVERTWVHGYYYNPMYAGFYYYSFSKG